MSAEARDPPSSELVSIGGLFVKVDISTDQALANLNMRERAETKVSQPAFPGQPPPLADARTSSQPAFPGQPPPRHSIQARPSTSSQPAFPTLQYNQQPSPQGYTHEYSPQAQSPLSQGGPQGSPQDFQRREIEARDMELRREAEREAEREVERRRMEEKERKERERRIAEQRREQERVRQEEARRREQERIRQEQERLKREQEERRRREQEDRIRREQEKIRQEHERRKREEERRRAE